VGASSDGIRTESDGGNGRDAVVPARHGQDGPAIVWDRFLTHLEDEDGHLWLKVLWWGYGPEEGTWECALKFNSRKVH